jgi:hypothetical protein
MLRLLGGVTPPTPLCVVLQRINNKDCRAMIWRIK